MKSKNNGTIRKIISKNTDTIYKYTIIFKALKLTADNSFDSKFLNSIEAWFDKIGW